MIKDLLLMSKELNCVLKAKVTEDRNYWIIILNI